MTPQSAKYSPWSMVGDVLLILVLGAAVITIAFAPWAEPIRTGIGKTAPHIMMESYIAHANLPKAPKL
jgi:hypothetical protein